MSGPYFVGEKYTTQLRLTNPEREGGDAVDEEISWHSVRIPYQGWNREAQVRLTNTARKWDVAVLD